MKPTCESKLSSSQPQIDEAETIPIAGTYAESTNEIRYLRYLEKLARQANSVQQKVSAGECYKTISEQLKYYQKTLSKQEIELKNERTKSQKLQLELERLRKEVVNISTKIPTTANSGEYFAEQRKENSVLKARVCALEQENKELSLQVRQFNELQGNNKDYQRLAQAYRIERMQSKQKSDLQQVQLQQLRQRISYIERLIPEDQLSKLPALSSTFSHTPVTKSSPSLAPAMQSISPKQHSVSELKGKKQYQASPDGRSALDSLGIEFSKQTSTKMPVETALEEDLQGFGKESTQRLEKAKADMKQDSTQINGTRPQQSSATLNQTGTADTGQQIFVPQKPAQNIQPQVKQEKTGNQQDGTAGKLGSLQKLEKTDGVPPK